MELRSNNILSVFDAELKLLLFIVLFNSPTSYFVLYQYMFYVLPVGVINDDDNIVFA